MDVLELIILLVECVVVGFGMAIGDWMVKVIAVRLLNSEQASLHDVDDPETEEEEDDKRKKRRTRKPPSKPSGGVGGGSGASIAVIP
jgi:hypothetical protein